MSGELEAAGAMATAGMVAGAIEGKDPGDPAEGACPNCGAKLEGRFCSNCGQPSQLNRTLGDVLEEFLHGLLHFDTKAWRTLPMVLFRPGTLTRNFVYGKRARYVSPLATFLLSIFFMFFAFSFVRAPVELTGSPEQRRAFVAEGVVEARAELAQAERELAAAIAAPDENQPEGLQERMARLEARLAREELARRETALQRLDAAIAAQARGEAPPAQEEIDGIGWSDGETWQDGVRRLAKSDDFVVVGGFPELNERARRQLENPDLAVYRILEAASKFAFLLVPMSLPFIALLFLWKRGVTFYDHVVYALYALSFASLLFVAVIFSAQHPWTNWLPGWLILLGLPVHTFFHLGGAYALGRWSAFWRTCFMLLFATIIASFFVAIIIIIGLAG